jgi:bifunctional non-homologous end joining protein LigD
MERLTKFRFTNLDKILYPKLEVKKLNIIEYYIKIAPKMLGFLAERIVVLNRFPDGVEEKGFYEKDSPRGTPSWVETFARFSETSGREINYIVCNDLNTLLWLANLAALEMHIALSQVESYENPDQLLFDLDPEPPAGFNEAVEVAFTLKENLDSLGFKSYIKTSGKKGLHVLLPLVGDYNFSQTREFVHQFGKYLARDSDLVVSELSQSKDPGKVYVDYLQNSAGRTMICPYSLRAMPKATVSTPVEWGELKGLNPEKLNVFTVKERKKNPWAGFWEDRQRLEAG